MKIIRFHAGYFTAALLLFIIEVLIALYVRDAIVRPYIGDLLVVIFLYCLVRSFFLWRPLPLMTGVLLFSYLIELLQYLHLVRMLGLQQSRLANVVLGSSFEWLDMVAYTAGAIITLLAEHWRGEKPFSRR